MITDEDRWAREDDREERADQRRRDSLWLAAQARTADAVLTAHDDAMTRILAASGLPNVPPPVRVDPVAASWTAMRHALDATAQACGLPAGTSPAVVEFAVTQRLAAPGAADAPSPMLHAARLAATLVAEAEAQGIKVRSVGSGAPFGVVIMTEDPALTAALAVALGLAERSEYTDVEFFTGERDGVRVSTHGPIPAPERAGGPIPAGAIAAWVCPCGSSGWLLDGASDEDRAAYDAALAAHDETCEVAA